LDDCAAHFLTRFSIEEKINAKTSKLKFFQVTAPAAINDNTAYTTATIDTLGYDEVLIEVAFGAMDIAVAALKAAGVGRLRHERCGRYLRCGL
jgi:hypothetical protein